MKITYPFLQQSPGGFYVKTSALCYPVHSLKLSVKMTLIVFIVSILNGPVCIAQAYRMKGGMDLAIGISGIAVQGGMQFGMHRDKSLPVPAAKQEFKWGPDHWFRYQYKTSNAKASDLMLAAQMALPLISTIPNIKDRGWVDAAMVCSQSLLWTMNVTQGVKLMKLRSRPLVYALNTPESVKNNIDARYSFISGHSSAAFCIATSFTLAMKQMNLPATRRTILGAASFVTAGGIAALRIAAGKHYPTDVLAGMVVGCGVALLNHHLHVRL
jgi:hypothetical protein